MWFLLQPNSVSVRPVSLSMSGGELAVRGISYAGIPLIVSGRNQDVSWAYVVSDEKGSHAVPVIFGDGDEYRYRV
jgi:acyl-homoserine lactone acylase PvdQ